MFYECSWNGDQWYIYHKYIVVNSGCWVSNCLLHDILHIHSMFSTIKQTFIIPLLLSARTFRPPKENGTENTLMLFGLLDELLFLLRRSQDFDEYLLRLLCFLLWPLWRRSVPDSEHVLDLWWWSDEEESDVDENEDDENNSDEVLLSLLPITGGWYLIAEI